MSRFLPYPLLTVALALTWLLLNAPITPGSAAVPPRSVVAKAR